MVETQKRTRSRVTEADFSTEEVQYDFVADVGDDAMSREDFDNLISDGMTSFREGEPITGTIIEKSDDYVVVDVGFKSEGVIPLYEFGAEASELKIGDETEVVLERTEDKNGRLVLSKDKANKIRVWDDIAKKYENDEVVEGVVTSKIKGGLTVDIGLKAFLPGSQIDLRPIKYLDKLIGETYQYKIIKMNKKRGNIVLSRRILLEDERKVTKDATLSDLEEGKLIEGIVKNITDYGAFIDLGGVDGLLHITDMSWGRVNHPSELFSIGDSVNIMVLKFDRETERVSLGLKQTTPDPWANAAEKYGQDTRVTGKVVSIADYGAFVELEEGIEGLVHITEMTWNKHVRHPAKVVNIGDMVEAVVLSLDRDKKRISLGMKQLELNPWEGIDEKYPVNSIIEGRVRNLADFGAFVELEEGVDGLIHISDMSWTQKIKHPSEIIKKKDKVKCIVLSVDKENERLSLGLKQLDQDPWEAIEERYPVGAEVKCNIVKVTNFGAFAEIESGIEGLIHVSQLSTNRVADPRKAVRVGQEVTSKVIKVDRANRKIGLSIKAFLEELSPEEVEKELKAMEELAAELAAMPEGDIETGDESAEAEAGGETAGEDAADAGVTEEEAADQKEK